MGLTLIRKSEGVPRKRKPKIALVLAGGAVSGGAFKVGGLKALDDYLVDRKVADLDMYIGLSAGSMLAVSLAAAVTPDEMVKVLEGTSGKLDQLTPLQFYNPNVREFVERPAKFVYDLFSYVPGVLFELVRKVPRLPEVVGPRFRAFLDRPNSTSAEDAGDGADRARLAFAWDSGAHQPHPDGPLRQLEPRALAAAQSRAHAHAQRLP